MQSTLIAKSVRRHNVACGHMAACAENPNRFGFLFLEDQLRFFREIEALTPLADGWQWPCDSCGRAAVGCVCGLPLCPNCGKPAEFFEREAQCTETHGLDCGPYETWTERWLVCSECGAHTTDDEVAAMNKTDEAEVAA